MRPPTIKLWTVGNLVPVSEKGVKLIDSKTFLLTYVRSYRSSGLAYCRGTIEYQIASIQKPTQGKTPRSQTDKSNQYPHHTTDAKLKRYIQPD